MDPKYTYRSHARWTVHRRGIVDGENIPGVIVFSTPPEFGGEPNLWTPEHFFLAAIASCYVATFRGVAEASKLEFEGVQVTVEGIIEKKDGRLRFTRVVLRPEATIYRAEDQDRTLKVLEKSERVCLVARSLSSEIVMEPKILVETPVTI